MIGTLFAALSEEDDAVEEMYEPYFIQSGGTSGRELPRRQPRFSRRVRNIASVTVLDLRRTSRIRHQELLSISYLPGE